MIYRALIGFRYFSIPPIPLFHALMYRLHTGIAGLWKNFTRIVWHTPLFQTRLEKTAPRLYLYDGMPLILGSVRISIGAGCRVGGGMMNIAGRTTGAETPQLIVGNNCDLGWGSNFMAGRRIVIGDNVRLAESVFLAGYSGHPFDAKARARGESDTEDQIGDIILENDVWLGTGVTVLRGVTIGEGTVVGAASVVTRDLPPFVLAAGNPAKVIRKLKSESARTAVKDRDKNVDGASVVPSSSSPSPKTGD